jgi:flavin reductase (DIM6/NTAB) family NADH-FMN oxidoreductase RutF
MSAISSDQFRDVIGHFATGVTVITAVDGEEQYGTTASAISSLSLEPPMLLICMNRQSSTGAAVGRVRRFAVNILNEHQDDLARRFATKAQGKFDGVQLLTGRYGEPLLADALAHVECHVVEEVSGGSHTVFLAEVHRASASAGTPLAYYRGEFGRLKVGDDDPADLPGPAGGGDMEDVVRGLCAAELGAAAMSIGRISASEVAELRALIDADAAFHSRLAALAGSDALSEAHHQLAAAVASTGPLQGSPDARERIVEAYERGDLPAAMVAIRLEYTREVSRR